MHGDSILVQRTLELKTVPPISNKLVESLSHPKVKNSAKGKVLMRASYGVKVETVFICSVFASAFSDFAVKLFDLNIDDKYLWAQALIGLQTSINSEIRNLYSTGIFTVSKELEAVDTSVKKLAISCFSVCCTIWIPALQSSLSRLDLHLMHGDSILVQRTLELKTVPPISNKLVESLSHPKVKNSAKGKVLMRVMYGVKVETVFIYSVFASAFSDFAVKLFDLNVDDKYLWAQALISLQTSINSEIRNLYSTGIFTVSKELEAVDTSVKKLYPMIQDGVDPIEVFERARGS
ncbi:protein bps1 [Quercus suber]|uniref:Protein bps1 n=1 Tax=Quercus suber TaxID=58331 RepID=A0AAW0KJJ4_QUESU